MDKAHAEILNQGVDAWNQWRLENPEIRPDLAGATFLQADLANIDFENTRLGFADLEQSDLQGANLRHVDLGSSKILSCRLGNADLFGAFLFNTDFTWTDLAAVSLISADLVQTKFVSSNLSHANLAHASLEGTVFANINLERVQGLDSVHHRGPSTLGIDTLYKSGGQIPQVFLRGCGLADDFIVYIRSLVKEPIQFYSCFISYSAKDQVFTERLHSDLQSRGIRCWYAPEKMKIGDKMRTGIDESIYLHDKLLLVLSKHSVESAWVEKEVETAMEKERTEKRTVLFPIRIDNTVMKIKGGWPADIRRSRHIGDFRRWKDHDAYQVVFDGLVRDLMSEQKS
jgi:hypothetical protein